MEYFRLWGLATWELVLSGAPWLVFGFLFAGIIKVMLPASFIEKQLKKKGFSSVLRSSLFGIPLPLCSCSVIPVGISLRRSGASKGATASFLVSTPEIGVDSFLLSYALLGLPLAIVRAVSSFVSAMTVGLLIDFFDDGSHSEQENVEKPQCCSKEKPVEKAHSLKTKMLMALNYGFVVLLSDLAPLLFFGFIGAGAVSAFLPNDFFQSLALPDWANLFAVMILALPLYVCATSSTPIAAVFLAKGLAPGAVLVFLLVGPATNFATMLAVGKELGAKALVMYLSGIAVIALIAGFLLNSINITLSTSTVDHLHHDGTIQLILAVLFSASTIWYTSKGILFKLSSKIRR